MTLDQVFADGDRMALAPQVLTEFVHVITDSRRFARPLTLVEATVRAHRWWLARDTQQLFPNSLVTEQFFVWMQTYRLGRKRLLDTLLAATYYVQGVTSILTTNPDDFRVFGCFTLTTPGQPLPRP